MALHCRGDGPRSRQCRRPRQPGHGPACLGQLRRWLDRIAVALAQRQDPTAGGDGPSARLGSGRSSPSHRNQHPEGPLPALGRVDAPGKKNKGIELVSLYKSAGSEQLKRAAFGDHFIACKPLIDQAWDFVDTVAIIYLGVRSCDYLRHRGGPPGRRPRGAHLAAASPRARLALGP